MKMIVAYNSRRAIGLNNQLLYRIKADLQNFKKLTLGRVIIMGRSTYESIGHPLQNRHTLVITSSELPDATGTLEDLLKHRTTETTLTRIKLDEAKLFPDALIVGGASIYETLMPFADEVLATEIFDNEPGDAHFPDLHPRDWGCHILSERLTDPNSGLIFRFASFKRREQC